MIWCWKWKENASKSPTSVYFKECSDSAAGKNTLHFVIIKQQNRISLSRNVVLSTSADNRSSHGQQWRSHSSILNLDLITREWKEPVKHKYKSLHCNEQELKPNIDDNCISFPGITMSLTCFRLYEQFPVQDKSKCASVYLEQQRFRWICKNKQKRYFPCCAEICSFYKIDP